MSEKIDVFLSYSHADAGIARDLTRKLEAVGLHCFVAEMHVNAGELWQPRIREALIAAQRIMFLITPRSRKSMWVAAEAGAAWALGKDLIACLMFVEPEELLSIVGRHQSRRIETQEEVDALVGELGIKVSPFPSTISGQWLDHEDGDTVYFRQVQDRVVGIYDFGSKIKKVGVYRGILRNSVFEYDWYWIDRDVNGRGQMTLSEDKKMLHARWWYTEEPNEIYEFRYRRMSERLPDWLNEKDLEKFDSFLKPKK